MSQLGGTNVTVYFGEQPRKEDIDIFLIRF
jgi:hypothetical protein